MKILLVEDEDRSARQTLESISRSSKGSNVVLATSRDTAIESIISDEFDLIICDVKLPPTDESVDLDERHGLAVHAAAKSHCPGTPTIFLTAFSTDIDVRHELSSGGVATIFTLNSYPLTQLIRKDEVELLEQVIARLDAAETALLESCLILGDHSSDDMLERAVRMYAFSTGNHKAEIYATSGLSGAKTCRVMLTSASMAPASVFIKVLPWDAADKELEQFNRYVPNRLSPGYFAPALPPLRAGLGKQAALISTLAESGSVSLFELMTRDAESAASAVGQLETALSGWRIDQEEVRVEIGDIRRRHISDLQLQRRGVNPLEFAEFERTEVTLRQSISHGDLHGENVLVDGHGRPLLIDFGDVGIGYASTDPVVLETSLAFHRDGPLRDIPEFSEFDWAGWLDLERLCANNPYEAVIRATRRWSDAVDSETARLVLSYAHCMRQIKYGEIGPSQLLGMARACAERISG